MSSVTVLFTKGRKHHLEHKVRIVARMTSEAHISIYNRKVKMQESNKKLWVGIDVGSKSFHAALDLPMLFENQPAVSVVDLPQREFKLSSRFEKKVYSANYFSGKV